MTEFDKLANEYEEMFGEAIPIYGISYDSENELFAIIRKAIADGKAIKPIYSENKETFY